MTDRWQRVESLCHAALARPAGERATFLTEACGDDEALRAEVESLLAGAEGSPSFLETPIAGRVPPPSLVGRQLGAYRIEAAIGAGGMGEVYRATDTRLRREVAVKILPAAFAADPQRRSRFEREARAVAALTHPHICTIHDVGHEQGIEFLVMELVAGESLAARLTKGPLPLEEALARAIEIADALEKAHGQGIIHRDLKPANVMLARTSQSRTTQAKLLDFGLARIMPAGIATGQSVPTVTSPMTEAGAMLGTLQYMAPEQIEGGPADARTDIFAFGALLYEMLTGRRAFEGASTAALMAAILREDPPPVHPPEVGRIVRRCLAKDPLRRYQAARDLLNDLEEVHEWLERGRLEAADAHPTRKEGQSGRRLAAWLTIGLAVSALAIAAYVGWPRATSSGILPVQRFQLQPPPGVAILPTSTQSVLAVSPDGQWVAFRGAGGPQNETALYVRSLAGLEAQQIAAKGTAPFFSPDSRWLGFFAENSMYKVPVHGGRSERICQVPNITSVRGASWGDDGTIVFSLDRALWRVSSAGGTEPVKLTNPDTTTRHYWPHVLPGGAAAVFTLNQGSKDEWRRIGAVSLATGEIRAYSELTGTAPRYVESGYLVYSRSGILYGVPFEPSRLQPSGDPVKLMDNVDTFDGSGSVAFDVSATGALVYMPEATRFPQSDLVWLDRQGNATPVGDERRRYVGAALDPAGKRLAAALATELEEMDLWLYEIDRGTWTQLTNGMQVTGELAWSPDGHWIFFPSFKSGEGDLFRVAPTTGRVEPLVADKNSWEHPGSVSSDGTLFFWKAAVSQSDLMTLKLEPRGTPKAFTNSPGFSEGQPRVSPDGRWVAYQSNESGSDQIHVRPFPGPGDALRVSPAGGSTALWSRDGRELFYRRGSEVWVVNIAPGNTFSHGSPRMLFRVEFFERSNSQLVPATIADRFLAIRREPPHRQLVYIPNWVEASK